jgi:hypothetical protein
MTAFKQFNSQDIIVSPLELNKSFSFSSSANLTTSDVGIDRYLGRSGNYLISKSIAAGVSSSASPQIPEVLIYDSVKQLYYTNYLSGSAGFSGPAATSSIVIGANEAGNVLVGNNQSTNYYNYPQTTLWPNRTLLQTSSVGNVGYEVGIVSIPAKLFGDKIQPNSFNMGLHGTSGSEVTGSVIDDGEGRLKFAPGNDVTGYDDYEYMYGNIIYEHGIIVMFSETLSGGVIPIYNMARDSNVTCSFSSSINIYETQYKATVFEDEYNYSQNPTIITGSTIPTIFSGSNINWENTASVGKPLDFATSSYFEPYITTVGLYDNAYRLLAVGKLAKPLPSSPTTDTTILVNIDR